MTAKDKEILGSVPLFSSLESGVCEGWIRDKKAFLLAVKKGETIMTAKNFNRCLVLITKGSATVSKIGSDGKRTVINTLIPGDFFGMATLFYEKEEYPSEIMAESPCRMIIFPKGLVEEIFESYPKFAKEYVTLLSEKIHFLNGRLEIFAESETEEKLLRYIIVIAKGRREFELPCSISRLAESLGVGRASVYRAFGSLSDKKILIKEGKKIVIPEPERL